MNKIKSILNWLLLFLRIRKNKPRGVIINIKGAVTNELRESVTERLTSDNQAVQKFLCSYNIPDDKVEALTKYVANLRKSYPDMKNDRVFRKAAEYFRFEKIKLV